MEALSRNAFEVIATGLFLIDLITGSQTPDQVIQESVS